MKKNPFKAFIPWRMKVEDSTPMKVAKHLRANEMDISEYLLSSDPTGGSWGSVGLVAAHEGNLVHDLDGAGYLINVQFNDRVLPAKVRDEHLQTKLNSLYEQTGRRAGKKEYAQLRDEVEFEQLPKSHIRRTNVYVLVTSDHFFVFTSSAKKANDAMAVVLSMFNEVKTATVWQANYANSVSGWLTTTAKEGGITGFWLGDNAVLKKEKECVRFKGVDLGGTDVDHLLKDEFTVTEMSLIHMSIDDEERLTFTLNEKGVFKAIALADDIAAEGTDKTEDGQVALHSLAWLVSREYRDLLNDITTELGGEAEQATSTGKQPPAADEDEL